jgi:hypothetical protein
VRPQTLAKLLTIGGLLALAGILWWFTVAAQQVTCEVCMEFGGGRRCATAAAETRAEAIHGARSVACGVLASGVRDSFACAAAQPASQSCTGG